MKKVALFLLLLIGVSFAENIHWLGDYNKALAKAKLEKKPLLLLVVSKESNSTRVLKTQFAKESVIKIVNSKTIPVITLYEGKNSYPIEMFYTTVFPTLFLVDSKDERLISKPLYDQDITDKKILNCFKSIKNYLFNGKI